MSRGASVPRVASLQPLAWGNGKHLGIPRPSSWVAGNDRGHLKFCARCSPCPRLCHKGPPPGSQVPVVTSNTVLFTGTHVVLLCTEVAPAPQAKLRSDFDMREIRRLIGLRLQARLREATRACCIQLSFLVHPERWRSYVLAWIPVSSGAACGQERMHGNCCG